MNRRGNSFTHGPEKIDILHDSLHLRKICFTPFAKGFTFPHLNWVIIYADAIVEVIIKH